MFVSLVCFVALLGDEIFINCIYCGDVIYFKILEDPKQLKNPQNVRYVTIKIP